MALVILCLSLVATFVGIFFTSRLWQKLLAFSLAGLTLLLPYLTTEYETYGVFTRSGGFPPSNQSVTGVRHHPLSLEFKIKSLPGDEVIAEGLKLDEHMRSDERRIDGKLVKIELLSLMPDGFQIHWVNELDGYVSVEWVARYSKWGDLIHKLGIPGTGCPVGRWLG